MSGDVFGQTACWKIWLSNHVLADLEWCANPWLRGGWESVPFLKASSSRSIAPNGPKDRKDLDQDVLGIWAKHDESHLRQRWSCVGSWNHGWPQLRKLAATAVQCTILHVSHQVRLTSTPLAKFARSPNICRNNFYKIWQFNCFE